MNPPDSQNTSSPLRGASAAAALLLRAALLILVLLLVRHQVSHARYTLGRVDHFVNVGCARGIFDPSAAVRRRWATMNWVTTGLPVLVPVGAAMRVFGTAPSVPRLTFAWLIWILVFVAGFALADFGAAALWIAVVTPVLLLPIILSFSWISLVSSVFGEVPSFLLGFAGATYLARSRDSRRDALMAGVLFALAVATKMIMALTLPAAALFLAWDCLRAEDRRAAVDRVLWFAAGLVAVGVVLTVFRFWLCGGMEGFRIYLQKFSPSGFTSESAGIVATSACPRREMHPILRAKVILRPMCGPGLGVVGIVIAALVVWRSARGNDSPAARLGTLLLGCSVLPLEHFLFLDPFGWLRRAVPAIGLAAAGVACLAAACPNRVLRRLFAAWLCLAAVARWHEWKPLIVVPRSPDANLSTVLDGRAFLADFEAAHPQTLAVYSEPARATIESITPFGQPLPSYAWPRPGVAFIAVDMPGFVKGPFFHGALPGCLDPRPLFETQAFTVTGCTSPPAKRAHP